MFLLSFCLHLVWVSFAISNNPFDNIEVPNIEKTLNLTLSPYEMNFSKYFHYNTWSLNTALLTVDPTKVTLSLSAEKPVLEKLKNESLTAHCIFDDLFDMKTFKMKPKVESQFLEQMTDICKLRLEETETLFTTDLPDEQKRQRYEQIKQVCDQHVEEYTIRVLKTYKEEVKLAASHHYDLKPMDNPRVKYEARIDNHFTRLGFEFLPIVEKYYQMCSDQYYRHFRQLPLCDKNLPDEEDKNKFHYKVETATMGSAKPYF